MTEARRRRAAPMLASVVAGLILSLLLAISGSLAATLAPSGPGAPTAAGTMAEGHGSAHQNSRETGHQTGHKTAHEAVRDAGGGMPGATAARPCPLGGGAKPSAMPCTIAGTSCLGAAFVAVSDDMLPHRGVLPGKLRPTSDFGPAQPCSEPETPPPRRASLDQT